MAENLENSENVVTNENPATENEEYEYEYIEVADGEELPEGAEYEYVEVVDDENVADAISQQTPTAISREEVPEPILSVPPVPQQNILTAEVPNVKENTPLQPQQENVSPLSQPIQEADLNALLDDDGEIQEVDTSTLLDGDYSDDFARNLFENKTDNAVEEVSLDDILGADAASTPAGFDEVKEVSPEELVAGIADRDDGSLRQSIWADLTDDEAVNTEADDKKVLYNDAGERQTITEETIIMSQKDEEPVVEAVPEPVVEAVPEPVVEAAPEPVVEAVPEPVVEAVPEPVVEAAPEPVVEAVPEPVVEAAPEPVVEAAPEPVVEAAPEPVVEAVPEPVVEAVPEPVVEAVPEPVVEAAPEPVVEAVPEPVVEAVPEPVVEAVPEPVVEAVPEPVVEAVPEPVVEAAPEPVVEAAPEPVVEAAPEPVVEAVPEPVLEPETEIMPMVKEAEAEVYAEEDSEPYFAEQKASVEVMGEKIPEKFDANKAEKSILGRVVQLAYQSVALTQEQHKEMLVKEHVADRNSGMQFFDLQGGSLLLNVDDVRELNDWHLIVFNQNLVPVQSDEKIEIIQPSDTIRMATVVKRGTEKLNVYNEEIYQFQNPQGEFLPAQKHFIYGQTDDDTGLIVNDFVNVDLTSHAGKVLNFENSVFGWLSGPEGAQIYFAQLGKLAVFAPEKKADDAEVLQKQALKWLSGNENDKYFEFSGASQSAEFVGNEEVKNIHINVGTSAYGWNVSFDNGVAMSLRDLQEFESKHGKLPSANGEISHGNLKLKFSNVEKIVVYQTPQYFAYGTK